MAVFRPQKKTAPEDTQTRILAASAKLFSKLGYEGTSIKRICTAAGVNIAAIHYHFGSKEGLLKHIVESFSDARLQMVQRLLAPPATQDDLRLRLEVFLHESLEMALQNADVWKIVQNELEYLPARTEAVFRKTIFKLCEVLTVFFTEAKKRGLMCKECDVDLSARLLFGHLAHALRMDNAKARFFGKSLKDETFRGEWIRQTLMIFLDGARPRT